VPFTHLVRISESNRKEGQLAQGKESEKGITAEKNEEKGKGALVPTAVPYDLTGDLLGHSLNRRGGGHRNRYQGREKNRQERPFMDPSC